MKYINNIGLYMELLLNELKICNDNLDQIKLLTFPDLSNIIQKQETEDLNNLST